MGKYFNEEGEEVEAFIQEEVDAQITTATETAVAEAIKPFEGAVSKEDLETKYITKEEHDKLSVNHDKLKDSYKNAKDEIERRGTEVETSRKDKREAYEKMRDEAINRASGDDKEYAEALKKQYDRVGGETLSVDELNKTLAEAHVLTLNEMGREITPFNPGEMVTKGNAPEVKKEEDKSNVDNLVTYAADIAGLETPAPSTETGNK